MAIVKYPEFSVKIILSESEELVFTHANGLKNIRAGRTFTSDNTKPAYGVYSQEGSIELFDANGEVYNMIEDGRLSVGQRVEIYFVDNLVGVYTTGKWTEQQDNLYSVELKDDLLKWQERTIQQKFELEFDKTAKDLYGYLVSLNDDWEFVLDSTTESHLESIKIKYYYWEQSTEWELWQKLCDLAQLYIYVDNKGKVAVISQKRIKELQSKYKTNAIVIPQNYIDGVPVKNKLNTNKITKVEVNENVITSEVGEILNVQFVVQDGSSNFVLQNSPIENAEIVDVSGVKNLRFIHEIKNLDYIISDLPFTTDPKKKAFLIYKENKNASISGLSRVDIMGGWFDKNEYTFSQITCAQLNKHSALNSRCFAIDIPLYNDEYRVQCIVLANKHFINKQNTFYGNGNDVYKIKSNELFSTDTKIDNIKISEENANQILNNFTGKKTISFSCVIADLYVNKKHEKILIESEFGGGNYYTHEQYLENENNWYYENYKVDETTGEFILYNPITEIWDLSVRQGEALYRKINDVQYGQMLEESVNVSVQFDEYEGSEVIVIVGKPLNKYKTQLTEEKTKHYNYQSGEILREQDIVQLQQTDGTYGQELWQVTSVEINAVGGRNFINVEAVEV